MYTRTSRKISDRFDVILLVTLILLCGIVRTGAAGTGKPETNSELNSFREAIRTSDEAGAMLLGNRIFGQLEKRFRGNPDFDTLKSKLMAAQSLADLLESQLKKAAGRQLSSVADELFVNKKQNLSNNSMLVAPAKQFYESSKTLFSKTAGNETFVEQEREFLVSYYDLKLRSFTSSIARAGLALAVAEPQFQSTHNYTLILPLLHTSNTQPIRIKVLPKWMQAPEQLRILSDSCLFHFGLPFQAMELAKKSMDMEQKQFSALEFYKSGAEKCGTSLYRVAVDCLYKAIDCIPENRHDEIVDIKFGVVQLWLDSEKYTLAAGEAKEIFDRYPVHPEFGRAIWLYYYALSRSNSTEMILGNIDKALNDIRCAVYKPKLMYIKWWALRRNRDQAGRIAALEHELLKRYEENSIIAPILLSQATDLLAQQNYAEAHRLLNQLSEKFPLTRAAQQATRILAKLDNKNID